MSFATGGAYPPPHFDVLNAPCKPLARLNFTANVAKLTTNQTTMTHIDSECGSFCGDRVGTIFASTFFADTFFVDTVFIDNGNTA